MKKVISMIGTSLFDNYLQDNKNDSISKIMKGFSLVRVLKSMKAKRIELST